MKPLLVLPFYLCAALSLANASELRKGQVVLQNAFETPEDTRGWSGAARTVPGLRGQSLVIARTNSASPSVVVSRELDLQQVRGCLLRITAQVKAQNVTAPPNPWNGIKLMLAITTPGRKAWPQASLPIGNFDWQPTGFLARIPSNATSARLVLGLEAVTGTAWFDDLKITVAKLPRAPQPPTFAGPIVRGHNLPRLRGAMVSPRIDEAGLRVLGKEWNANLIRWQLIRHVRPGQTNTLDDYDAWLQGELARFDTLLPACAKYGLYVCLDLHSPPGGKGTVSGYAGTDARLFTDRAVQDHFVNLWRRIAARYRNVPQIWGYDLANEPVEEWVADDCDDWHGLAERTAKAIREIDPNRAIIVEAPPWGSPESLADFEPIAVSNVVYSAHMYVPHAFTHQGVHSNPAMQFEYPGMIEGRHWDKAALEQALQPVVDFQKTYNVPIYMGEFSAIRWAPKGSARRYLSDVIDIFETHAWDWSYHAFREWQGWSVEHGPDRLNIKPATEPTDRQRLLQQWFAKNAKPNFPR